MIINLQPKNKVEATNKMGLNKQKGKGNMYGFIDKTRNFIGGECKHKCQYCFINSIKNKFPNIKERYSGEIRLLESELKKNEGKGKTIFVQDMGDLFADNIPKEFIIKVLEHLRKYPKNNYLFQTKNPKRFIEFKEHFPVNSLFGTTIETNRQEELNKISEAPPVKERVEAMNKLQENGKIKEMKIFLTLEPLIDFDLIELVHMIKNVEPEFVNIGADSKGKNLPEPSWEKVQQLIKELEKFTKVNLKENLERLKITPKSVR